MFVYHYVASQSGSRCNQTQTFRFGLQYFCFSVTTLLLQALLKTRPDVDFPHDAVATYTSSSLVRVLPQELGSTEVSLHRSKALDCSVDARLVHICSKPSTLLTKTWILLKHFLETGMSFLLSETLENATANQTSQKRGFFFLITCNFSYFT